MHLDQAENSFKVSIYRLDGSMGAFTTLYCEIGVIAVVYYKGELNSDNYYKVPGVVKFGDE